MKRSIWIYLVLGITSFIGCKKYEEGPLVSLRSRTERVSDTWRVESVTVNGEDVTEAYDDYKETYEDNGNYTYQYTFGGVSFNGTGKWEFINKDEEIRITDVTLSEPRILYILRLEENSLWYYYYEDTEKREFHLRAD